jgi:hypothetical protein
MVPAGTSQRTLAFEHDWGIQAWENAMKFKFPDRVSALEFVMHLASLKEFAINGIVHGDVVDVPIVEPDRCSSHFLLELETAAHLLGGVKLPANSNADDRFSFLVDRVHRIWRKIAAGKSESAPPIWRE